MAVAKIGNWAGLTFPFAAAIFLSAALLFSLQPLVAKLLLPLLGGAPSVWNTVMVFFQAMLLAGYGYAHVSERKFGRFQPLVHVMLLIAAGLFLSFGFSGQGQVLALTHPGLWLLLALLLNIGLPTFALASTAPLLQKWFSRTRHTSAKDPYFLYAGSNLGSFGALLAYPLVIEPFLRLQTQTRIWALGFWMLIVCIAVCAVLARTKARTDGYTNEAAASEGVAKPVMWKWVGLSFVPASLMLGVSNFITTDVASVPLLWVLPLGLYLLTFVIAFSKYSNRFDIPSSRAVPILALAVIFGIVVHGTEPVAALVLLHAAFFFAASLQSHLKLARSRPPTQQLTQFYLCMSVGGVMGGIFNGLVAPVIFDAVIEYPLMIVIATVIGFPQRTVHKGKFSIPPVYGGATIILAFGIASALIVLVSTRNILIGNLLAGLIVLGCYVLVRRPIRFALALGTLLLFTSVFRQNRTGVIERDRNFFGVLRVEHDPQTSLRRLYHGTTLHGIQSLDPQRKCEPLSYYHREGPVSRVTELHRSNELSKNVGLIGLGAGAMVTYARPEERWTVYEIDPDVIRIARDQRFFTYLRDCTTAQVSIELGDARLRLQSAPDAHFGLLYVDAFSSDVVPMHLITVEAIKLYRRKLVPDGILAFHLSSRHFALAPLVANIGGALRLQCFESTEGDLNAQAIAEGGFESIWAILVPETRVEEVTAQGAWSRVDAQENGPLWQDDFSSLMGVFKF